MRKKYKFTGSFFFFYFILTVNSCFLFCNSIASSETYESSYELFNQLNLSENERQIIQGIRSEEKKQLSSYEYEIENLQSKLSALLNLDNSIEGTLDMDITQLKSQIESHQSIISSIKTKTWKQIRESLSSENQELLHRLQFQN